MNPLQLRDPEISENTFQWKILWGKRPRDLIKISLISDVICNATERKRKSKLINNMCSLERHPQAASPAEKTSRLPTVLIK